MSTLTTTIPIKDRNGRVVDEKEVVTYAGLLHRAHQDGLKSIHTLVVATPTEANDGIAVVHATVVTEAGTFTGVGDASAASVNATLVPHILRMAETRAKARALRDALNIGTVAIEELRGDEANGSEQPRPNLAVLPQRRDWRSDPMSEAQRRLLFRLLASRGHHGQDAIDVVLGRFGVDDISQITKAQASELIDLWKSDAS